LTSPGAKALGRKNVIAQKLMYDKRRKNPKLRGFWPTIQFFFIDVLHPQNHFRNHFHFVLLIGLIIVVAINPVIIAFGNLNQGLYWMRTIAEIAFGLDNIMIARCGHMWLMSLM
jgi:hypothetical protein